MDLRGDAFYLKCEMLKKTQWASDFTLGEIEQFADYLFVVHALKDMPVFSEGDEDAFMCLIVEGSISIVKEDYSGMKKTITTLHDGNTFGEIALIDGSPRSASAIAVENSTLLTLHNMYFKQLLDNSPNLGIKILFKLARLMSQRLRVTTDMLIDYL